MSDDQFTEPGGTAETEIKVKGSRFIARVFRVRSADDAEERIRALRKAEYDATHHCSAWRVEPDQWRYHDDGEPSGSAGPPIFRQIEASGLCNVLVVVTRYYGGTKLGTGGLIRAYGDAAAEALSRVEVRTVTRRDSIRVGFAYDDTSPAMHTLSKFDAVIAGTEYGDRTTLTVAVRRSQSRTLREALVQALSGRVDLEEVPAD